MSEQSGRPASEGGDDATEGGWGAPQPPADRSGRGSPAQPGGQSGWGSPAGSPAQPGGQSGWGSPQAPGRQQGWDGTQPPGQAPSGWGRGPGWGAPQPGVIPLRPLAVSELLDGAVRVIRTHPRIALGASAVVAVVTSFLTYVMDVGPLRSASGATTGDTFDVGRLEDALGATLAVALVTVVVTVIADLLLTGYLIELVGKAVLGRKVDGAGVWHAVRPRLPGLLGVAVCTVLIALAGAAVIAVPLSVAGVLVGGDGGNALVAIGLLGGTLVAVWLSVSLSLSTPAYILEQQTIRRALRRSRALVRGSWWRVLGVLLLATVITLIVGSLLSLPFALAAGATSQDSGDLGAGALAVVALGSIVAGTVTRPFTAGVTALLYIDRRMRSEGLDVTLARAAAESPR